MRYLDICRYALGQKKHSVIWCGQDKMTSTMPGIVSTLIPVVIHPLERQDNLEWIVLIPIRTPIWTYVAISYAHLIFSMSLKDVIILIVDQVFKCLNNIAPVHMSDMLLCDQANLIPMLLEIQMIHVINLCM